MPDQESLKASEKPQESIEESWTYPEAFDTALRGLYERSSAACALSPDVQAEVQRELEMLGAEFCLGPKSGCSIHTAEVCAAGRPDLTGESLMLSGSWRAHFPPSWIQGAESRLSALAYVSEQQALLESGGAASTFPDWRLEEAGYRVRAFDKRLFVVFEPAGGVVFGNMLLDNLPLKWGEGQPCMEVLCDEVLKCEDRLHRTLFLNYKSANHRHHLFCESCPSAAPIVSALDECVADEQFRRMRLYLANLVECLDSSDLKVKKLAAALALPKRDGSSDQDPEAFGAAMLAEGKLKEGVLWRAFLLINYLPYVADMFVYCPKPRTPEQAVNPWTALRSGEGYQGAVRFVQSLTRQEFEAAVFAHEILSAIPDYPDCLAFRWKLLPMEAPQVPSCQEGLQPLPGYLRVREQASNGDWAAFVNHTLAEEMPWWGFSMLEGLFKVAAKAARTTLVESGLEGVTGSASERLEAIENRMHAIYGAQLPMLELEVEAKLALDQVARRQKEQSDILQQIRDQPSRPTKHHAEASLRRVLGDAVFGTLTDEAKTAALEGELRFLQGDYADPSVIPFQFAKAFECQLRSKIVEPFRSSGRIQTDYKFVLKVVFDMLEQSQADFLKFLREHGFDYRLLQQKVQKLIDDRNLAAHQAAISEQRALRLRLEWLGVGRSNDSIFAALVPKNAAGYSQK